MENKKLINCLSDTLDLLQLHQQNPFQIRMYQQAILQIQQHPDPIYTLQTDQLAALFGQSMSQKIVQIIQTGTHEQLEFWQQQTPPSVMELLKIDGLGPKKAYTLWKEYNIESPEALLDACQQNRLLTFKGFAQKTQTQLLESCLFHKQNKGKFRLDQALEPAQMCLEILSQMPVCLAASIVGSVARYCPIIEKTEFLVACHITTQASLEISQALNHIVKLSAQDPWTLHGQNPDNHQIFIYLCSLESYPSKHLLHTSTPEHLKKILPTKETFGYWIKKNQTLVSDQEFYHQAGLPYIIAPARENAKIFDRAIIPSIDKVIDFQALKGALHNHSTWSDGQNTIEQMAGECIHMGLEYLGMADHSVSAFYANGLDQARLFEQIAQINALNVSLAPFRIFKGVESDILSDGRLDYPLEVLAALDYVVASVHSSLKMDSEQATNRLIRAIENPYTTILGHPTGRLLLRRQGYKPNINKVLDACAANNVVVELNANPYRLDLDYTHLAAAIDKGVLVSINPDAHSLRGLYDMQYGVWAAQKALLPASRVLNAFGLEQIKAFFELKNKPKQ